MEKWNSIPDRCNTVCEGFICKGYGVFKKRNVLRP